MPWFGGGGSGRNCDDDPTEETKKKKECDGCFPSKAGTPIVVKITRPRNNVNASRMNNCNRFGSNRGDCCKWCNNKANINQMVFNQNKILNHDLINRINDINASAANPGVSLDPNQANPNLEKTKCGNCIRILREKELELLKKEQEILKIKTHFTTLPKTGKQDGLGTNCEHCFKALREKEYELFRKEQEIAKMKMAAITNPIDTKAKVDRAKCANCYKALRKKELELLKKEHALTKNLTRPNINVKNLNYCSCCRDKNKSSANQFKKAEEMRRKNRDNCFKALRMKEIQLLQKEREIDKKIQKFREESIAKARRDLEKVPDPRLVSPKERESIKCVCSCSGPNNEEAKKAKGLCKVIYNKLPPALGGMRHTTPTTAPNTQVVVKKSKSGEFTFKQPRTCPARCCVFKLATKVTSYLLHEPGSKKQPKQKLPPSCSFMKLVTWCSPGHLQQANVIQKCCTMLTTTSEKKAREKEDKQIVKQQAEAIKVAKADSKAIAKTHEYRVETIGEIRPGKSKPKSTAKLDIVESEVLRTSGPQGLEIYKTKMAKLEPTAVLRQSKMKELKTSMPKYSTTKESKTEENTNKGFNWIPKSKTKGLTTSTEYKNKEFKIDMPKESKSQAERYKTKGLEKYPSKAPQKATFKGKGFEAGDIETSAPKSFGSKARTGAPSRRTSKMLPHKVGDGTLIDDHQTSMFQNFSSKIASFKPKVGKDEHQTSRSQKLSSKIDTFKPKVSEDDHQTSVSQKLTSKIASFTPKVTKDRESSSEVDREVKSTKKRKNIKVRVDDDEFKEPKKYKTKKYEDEDEPPKRKRSRSTTGRVDDGSYEETRSYRSKSYDDDISWDTGPTSQGSKQRETHYMWRAGPPLMPTWVKILGRSIIYCAGCFIGVPCIVFLCLCLLCSTCSD